MQPLKEKGRVLWAFAGNPNALTIHAKRPKTLAKRPFRTKLQWPFNFKL